MLSALLVLCRSKEDNAAGMLISTNIRISILEAKHGTVWHGMYGKIIWQSDGMKWYH